MVRQSDRLIENLLSISEKPEADMCNKPNRMFQNRELSEIHNRIRESAEGTFYHRRRRREAQGSNPATVKSRRPVSAYQRHNFALLNCDSDMLKRGLEANLERCSSAAREKDTQQAGVTPALLQLTFGLQCSRDTISLRSIATLLH